MTKYAILGKMASGKTTLAHYILNKDSEFEIYSFGDKVKTIAKDLFKMENKDRQLLQSIGTKLREIDPDVWVNYVISQIKDKNKIIIDDLRYENELLALKKKGFYIIYLEVSKETQIARLKKKYENFSEHLDNLNHSSEMADNLSHYADYTLSTELSDLEYDKIVSTILLKK